MSSGSGWSLVNPDAAAIASGQLVPGATTNAGATAAATGAGATTTGGIVAAAWDPYQSAGVNGDWFANPVGKDPVTYAYYASLGAVQNATPPAAAIPGLQAILAGGATALPTPASAPATPAAAAKTAEDAKKAEAAKKAGAAKPAAAEPAASKTYTVKSGDTLSGIAGKLGLGGWNALYDKNAGVIGGNPSVIRPGQVLQLP